MTWLHTFFGCFLFQPMAEPNRPTADFNGAAIPPPIFSMLGTNLLAKEHIRKVLKQLYKMGSNQAKVVLL